MSESTRLAQRLELGWAKIDEAREANDIIREQQWTNHWLQLEAQYRAAFDAEPDTATHVLRRTEPPVASQGHLEIPA